MSHSRPSISGRSGFVCAANGACGSSCRGMGADCDPGHPPAAGTMVVDTLFGGGARIDLAPPFFARGFAVSSDSQAGSQPQRIKGQPFCGKSLNKRHSLSGLYNFSHSDRRIALPTQASSGPLFCDP